MPTATHLPVNTGQWEGDHREPGADSRKPTAETAIGCPLTAIRCQRALSLPAPTVILSASEGSWYMPIMTHLSVNAGQREADRLEPEAGSRQQDSETAGQRDSGTPKAGS